MREVDVLVIGREHAADALERARDGATVLVVDELASGGGLDDVRRAGIEVLLGHDVWLVEPPGGRVGVTDGQRSFPVAAREVVGLARTVESDERPMWERAAQALVHPASIAVLATEEERAVPRLAAFESASRRIESEVAAGRLSPFVLSRFRRRSDEEQFRLGADAPPAEAERAARALESELREGARR